MPQVTVHEFGHSFGGLLDEYINDVEGNLTNEILANCYSGKPPVPSWQNYVASGDYYSGCTHGNWYRTSSNSMMLDLTRYFNTISQFQLNLRMDQFVPAYSDNIAPSVRLVSPTFGSTITTTQPIVIEASDNSGVARVELWKNQTLFTTVYDLNNPYLWNIVQETNNQEVTWQAKAFDSANNSALSEPVSVRVTHLPDNNPPVVEFLQPRDGDTVHENMLIAWNIKEDSGILKTELFLNEDMVHSATELTTNYSNYWWPITQSDNGQYVITAKAYDMKNNVGEATVRVTVQFQDITPPYILVSSPKENQMISGPNFWPDTKVWDNYEVKKVEFFWDEKLYGTVLPESEYNSGYYYTLPIPIYDYSNLSKHTFKIIGYDTSNNSNESPTFTVIINDNIGPEQIKSLLSKDITSSKVTLQWIAPGDDNYLGTAAYYEGKLNTTPINETNWSTSKSWAQTLPAPAIAGTYQTFTVENLKPNTNYFFALKAVDEVGNSSPISENISVTTKPAPTATPCPMGRTRPYYKMVNKTCTLINACGISSCNPYPRLY